MSLIRNRFYFFKRATILLVLLLSAPAFSIEIFDPKNILNKIPFVETRQPFDSAFQCLQPERYFIRSGFCQFTCHLQMCEETCNTISFSEGILQAENCNKEELNILSTHFAFGINVKAQQYNSDSKTLIRSMSQLFLKFYDQVSSLEVEDLIYPYPKLLIENGKMKKLNTVFIYGRLILNNNKDNTQGFQIIIDPMQSGLNQVLCVSLDNGCDTTPSDYIIKRKGLMNHE